jgi:UDP-N-acetylmuramate dehydrogenase
VRDEHRAALREALGGVVTFDAELARLTTYRIGGPAAALVEPVEVAQISAALRLAVEMDLRWMVLGLGSNLLLPDAGIDGVVIRMGKGIAGTTKEGAADTLWTVAAGLPTQLLAKRTAGAGLGGVHRLIGVPGTVGGGVFMNAGAHGQEFKDVVTWVDVVAPDGTASRVSGGDVAWRYRSSGLDSVVVAAQLQLAPEDPKVLEREVRDHLRWRKAGTPFDEPCCGSVFRNPAEADAAAAQGEIPEPCTAGRVIDAAGLKGFRVGGAEVSRKHANYIVNTGGASAADVSNVIAHVRETVMERYGIELQLEVKIIDG